VSVVAAPLSRYTRNSDSSIRGLSRHRALKCVSISISVTFLVTLDLYQVAGSSSIRALVTLVHEVSHAIGLSSHRARARGKRIEEQ
jgi:hypothetical protein